MSELELWEDGVVTRPRSRAGDVVKAEMPAVERKNDQLLLQMSADRKKVAELEADILKRLSEAQGNILDDEDLINTLAESKKVSIMIGKRMEAAVVTKQEIDEAREAYRTVATRGSIIYFVIADMARTRRPAVPRRLHAIFMNRLRERIATRDPRAGLTSGAASDRLLREIGSQKSRCCCEVPGPGRRASIGLPALVHADGRRTELHDGQSLDAGRQETRKGVDRVGRRQR